MVQVEWTELAGEQAETLLAVLLYNKYPKATRVRPSQGDFGIDVLLPSSSAPEMFDVYQIKKFAQSLTDSQKGHVEKSLRRLLIGLVRRNVPTCHKKPHRNSRMPLSMSTVTDLPGADLVTAAAKNRQLTPDWIVAQRVLLGSRCGVALRDGGDRVVATSSEPHADVESGASV